MLGWFLLGLVLLVGVAGALRWFATTPPRDIAKVLRWVLITVGGLLVVFLAVTGRLTWLIAALGALLPMLWRLRRFAGMARTFSRAMGAGAGGGTGTGGAGGSGEVSEVRTAHLHMRLDHDSGAMDGQVLDGRFAGQRLSDMDRHSLLDLLAECADDDQSVRVLEAYLDRADPDWREAARARAGQGGGSGAGDGTMTEEQALEILGLEPGADEGQIKSAYHRLIAKLHPDHGGSTYLASQINRAKEVLLSKTGA